jgi:hypothetical protein
MIVTPCIRSRIPKGITFQHTRIDMVASTTLHRWFVFLNISYEVIGLTSYLHSGLGGFQRASLIGLVSYI